MLIIAKKLKKKDLEIFWKVPMLKEKSTKIKITPTRGHFLIQIYCMILNHFHTSIQQDLNIGKVTASSLGKSFLKTLKLPTLESYSVAPWMKSKKLLQMKVISNDLWHYLYLDLRDWMLFVDLVTGWNPPKFLCTKKPITYPI